MTWENGRMAEKKNSFNNGRMGRRKVGSIIGSSFSLSSAFSSLIIEKLIGFLALFLFLRLLSIPGFFFSQSIYFFLFVAFWKHTGSRVYWFLLWWFHWPRVSFTGFHNILFLYFHYLLILHAFHLFSLFFWFRISYLFLLKYYPSLFLE